MSVITGNNGIVNGLVLNLDAANPRSYTSGSTIWYDTSGNRNNGTLTGTSSFDPNNSGNLLLSSSAISFPTVTVTPNNSTQTIWYKWNGVNQSNSMTYIGSGGGTGFGFFVHNGSSAAAGNKVGILYGGINFNAIVTGLLYGTLVSGVWTYLVVTRNTSTTILYQDGNLIGTCPTAPNSPNTLLTFAYSGVVGNVSNIQLYNRALSQDEIQQNFNATRFRYGI